MAKKYIILIILVILITLFFEFLYPILSKPEESGLSVIYLDSDGNEIKTKSFFAIVGTTEGLGTPNVAFIKLKVNVANTGAEILTCNLNQFDALTISSTGSVNPNYFENSMTDSTERTILVGKSASWITDQIDVNLIAEDSDIINGYVKFTAVPQCFDIFGEIDQPTPSDLELLINVEGTPQGTASLFVTQVLGTSDLYCGDNICSLEIGESLSNCPTDCVNYIQKVKFRTSDLNYGANSEIAYSSVCLGTLAGYGRVSSGSSSGTCSSAMPSGNPTCPGTNTNLQIDLPGIAGGMTGGYPPSLWQNDADPTILCVCDSGETSNFRVRYDSDETTSIPTQLSSMESGQEINEVNFEGTECELPPIGQSLDLDWIMSESDSGWAWDSSTETINIMVGLGAVKIMDKEQQYSQINVFTNNVDVSQFELADNTLSGSNLEFWIYIDDASYHHPETIEFGNANNEQQAKWMDGYLDTISWQDGWQYISLPFGSGGYNDLGSIEWDKVDYIEIYNAHDTASEHYFILDGFKVVRN